MKKPINNNRYRHNNGGGYNNSNQIYSLNYKFDSNSIAGKCSGTALDLIKRYNELARDAQNNNDVVNAEIFRQYAEHYRKIVTDINDKKNVKTNYFKREDSQNEVVDGNVIENTSENLETETQTETAVQENMPREKTSEASHEHRRKPMVHRKREFTIVEVKESSSDVKKMKSEEVESGDEKKSESEEKAEKKPKVSRTLKATRISKTTKKTAEETVAAV